MDRMLAELAVGGAAGVHVGVDPRNTAAVAFYRHLGFDEWGRPAPGVTVLVRPLTPVQAVAPSAAVDPVRPVTPVRPRPDGSSPPSSSENGAMTATDAPEAVADPPAPEGSAARGRWPRSYLGLVCALVGIALALTPSLLPRPWLFQGLIAGIAGAIGYGIGVLVSWAWRRVGAPEPSSRLRLGAWRALAVGGSLLSSWRSCSAGSPRTVSAP